MTEDQDRPQRHPIDKEDARLAYQMAVAFWTYQGQLNWNRFNVMLVANSVVISVLAAVASSQSRDLTAVLLLACGGLLLCVAWAFLTTRGFAYHRYWGLATQELEREFSGVKLTARLKALHDGVTLAVGEDEAGDPDKSQTVKYRFKAWEKVKQRYVTYAVILGFAIGHSIVIAYGLREVRDYAVWRTLLGIALFFTASVLVMAGVEKRSENEVGHEP